MKVIMKNAHEIRRKAQLKVSYKEQMSICLKLSWKIVKEDNFSIDDAIKSLNPNVIVATTVVDHSTPISNAINEVAVTVSPTTTVNTPSINYIKLKYNNGNKRCSIIESINGVEKVLKVFICSDEDLSHRVFIREYKDIIKNSKDITLYLSANAIDNLQKMPILKRVVIKNNITLKEVNI